MEFLQAGQYRPVPQGITTVVAVLHDKDHYAVLEIDITKKTVLIYYGLYRDLDRWLDYVFSAFKHCMLWDLQIPHLYVADDPFAMESVRRTQTIVNELSMLCINFHLVMNTC